MSTPDDWHYPWSVRLYVDGPVSNGQLPVSDWSEALDYVESMPLRQFWLDSLSPRERETLFPLFRWHVDRSGVSSLRKLRRRGLDAELRMAQNNDLARVSLGQSVEIEGSPERWAWRYDVSFGFTAHVETREFMDGWGGGSIEVLGRDDFLSSDAFVDAAKEALRHLLVICNGSYGCISRTRATIDDPNYSRASYPPPPIAATVPGAAWLSILPPLVVSRLGGIGRIAAEHPVFRLEEVVFKDGSSGALVQVIPTIDEFDPAVHQAWTSYLAAVITPE